MDDGWMDVLVCQQMRPALQQPRTKEGGFLGVGVLGETFEDTAVTTVENAGQDTEGRGLVTTS